MSDEKTVVSADEAAKLPAGQWVADKGGTFWCLVDTHMGFPQRMAMSKGGRSYCGQVSHDPRPMTFSPSDLDVFRAVAEHRARHTNQSDGAS